MIHAQGVFWGTLVGHVDMAVTLYLCMGTLTYVVSRGPLLRT